MQSGPARSIGKRVSGKHMEVRIETIAEYACCYLFTDAFMFETNIS
jgi:hypothetical protein